MQFFTEFLLISIFLGPGLAISYGLGDPEFNPAAHLITLLLLETLGVAIVYLILRKVPTDIRFNNRVLDKVAHHLKDTRTAAIKTLENVSELFMRRMGDMGFYAALAFISFAYGVYIAAIVAYLLKVRLRRAMISIASGGAVAIVFWYVMALGYVPFITPISVFVFVTMLSVIFITYGYFQENCVVCQITDFIEDGRRNIEKNVGAVRKEIKKRRLSENRKMNRRLNVAADKLGWSKH